VLGPSALAEDGAKDRDLGPKHKNITLELGRARVFGALPFIVAPDRLGENPREKNLRLFESSFRRSSVLP
jgi:hypothetical protein